MSEPTSLMIPKEELEKLYKTLDLNESMQIRVFIYPHRDQVKELDLVRFELSEKCTHIWHGLLESYSNIQVKSECPKCKINWKDNHR